MLENLAKYLLLLSQCAISLVEKAFRDFVLLCPTVYTDVNRFADSYASASLKILVNSIIQPGLQYENVAVSDENPILRDLLFSHDHQYLYALTDKQVRVCVYCANLMGSK